MGLIGRLSATARPRAFPVVGWRGAQYWDALRASHRVVPSTAPHDADLLLCLGELPQLWHSDLLRLYETVALPRLPVVMSPSIAGAGAKLPGAVHLRPDQLDEDRRWSEIRVAQFDLSRANNRQSLEDRPPAPWRDIGPHGQGGEGMMGGTPFGRAMAMTAEDPDQLALDDVATALGPFFPGLPTGLRIDLQVQGDRIRSINYLENLFPPTEVSTINVEPPLAPFIAFMAGEVVTVAAMERARIRAHLSWSANLLALCGLEALAQAFIRAAVEPPPASATRHLFDRAERAGLRFVLRGVGTIDQATADELHLVGPITRASGVQRDARLDDASLAAASFQIVTESAGDCWARWRVRRRECLQSFALIERSGDRPAGSAEAPNGELRRRGESRLAGASAANMTALGRCLPGLEWFEALLFVASLGLDMQEAALR